MMAARPSACMRAYVRAGGRACGRARGAADARARTRAFGGSTCALAMLVSSSAVRSCARARVGVRRHSETRTRTHAELVRAPKLVRVRHHSELLVRGLLELSAQTTP